MRPRKGPSVAGLVGSPEEETSRPNLRLRVVGIAVLVLFGVLVVRLWTLQVIDAKTYAAQVTRNQVRVVAVSPPRGEIVDRNDTVLAGGQPQEEILLSRVSAAQNPSVVAKVAALIGQTPTQVQTTVNNDQYGPYEPMPLATGIPAATVQYLQVHQSDYPGVSRADGHPAHLSPGRDHGGPRAGLPRRHHAAPFSTRTRTPATPRAARWGIRASRRSTRPTCAGSTGARRSR